MSETTDVEQPRKKKHHHGWWIALLVIVLVLGVAVGGIYFLFYDDSNPNFPVAKTDSDQTALVQRKVVDAFDDTKETGNLSFVLKEEEMNQLLANVREQNLSEQVRGYVRGALTNVQDNHLSLDLYLDAQVLGFKSKISAAANVAETDDAFTLEISGLHLGSTTFLDGVAKGILQKYVTQESVDSLISSSGLQMTFDMSALKGTYTKEAMREDMNQLMEASQSKDDRYAPVVKAMLGHDAIHLTHKDAALGFDLSLENAHTNETFVSSEKETPEVETNLIADAAKVKTLLDNGTVDENTLHTSYVYQLLGIGYNSLADDAKIYVDSLDLSSIGIADAKSETGHHYASSYDLTTNINNSLASLLTGSSFAVSEDDLSSIIQSSGLLGYGLLIPAKQEDDRWKTAWVGINATYINIFDDRMVINIGIDVAGYECYFIIDSVMNADKSAALPYGLVLDPQAVYVGNEAAESDVAQGIYTLVSAALASKNLSWISMDPESGEITMDISKAVPTLSSSGVSGLDLTLKGSDLAAEGKMEISLAKSA